MGGIGTFKGIIMLVPKNIKQIGFAYPSQWEGKLIDDKMFYIRYRHGSLSISISEYATNDINDAVDGKVVLLDKRISTDYSNQMSTNDMQNHTATIFDWSNLHNQIDK
jgi:hypothetical protein